MAGLLQTAAGPDASAPGREEDPVVRLLLVVKPAVEEEVSGLVRLGLRNTGAQRALDEGLIREQDPLAAPEERRHPVREPLDRRAGAGRHDRQERAVLLDHRLALHAQPLADDLVQL